MLGHVCLLPFLGGRGEGRGGGRRDLALDTPAKLAASSHGHHGESPGLGHGTPDYRPHSALTCCVTQSPLLFLSGLQFPHLRNAWLWVGGN